MGEEMTVAKGKSNTRFDRIATAFDRDEFNKLNATMSFDKYLDMVYENPMLAVSAYGRMYDMVVSKGVETIERCRKTVNCYNFFNDPDSDDRIFGLEEALEEFVKALRGAAGGYGTEKRILLFRGPVGSSKSTICRLLKRGLERYTATDRGAVYTYKWVGLAKKGIEVDIEDEKVCPTWDDPLKLVPASVRKQIQKELNSVLEEQHEEAKRKAAAKNQRPVDPILVHKINLSGELNPLCQLYMTKLLKHYEGNWSEVVKNHIEIVRLVFNEAKRRCIGTFQPKDEKNQDATELTGDVNFMKLGQYGVDSDARAFSFDGEFEVANRGFLEWIEVLKLDKAFLYDLLGAAQERQIKPKKFPQVDIDLVLIGHTNDPEYQKLQGDDTMEALKDRTVKIDIPYVLRTSDELKILEKDYGKGKCRQHIAPHTLEIAALWGVLTRLDRDKDNNITLVEKAKLYDGKILEGWTEDKVREMQAKYNEGFKGISARYTQNKISNALVARHDYINPFMVLNEIKEGLKHYTLVKNEEEREKYRTCVDYAKKELDEILKKEVQQALTADANAIVRLCANYIDNVFAYINESKVKDPYTGKDVDPDEQLMRSIEEKVDVPEPTAPDFRRSIAAMVGDLSRRADKAKAAGDENWERHQFKWDSNPRLKRALELKLFEDTKDSIKLSSLNVSATAVVDKDLQEKIDAIKTRLINNFGYNEQSAADVLSYVGSIFARGDMISG